MTELAPSHTVTKFDKIFTQVAESSLVEVLKNIENNCNLVYASKTLERAILEALTLLTKDEESFERFKIAVIKMEASTSTVRIVAQTLAASGSIIPVVASHVSR